MDLSIYYSLFNGGDVMSNHNTSHGSLKQYIIGFILSIILTIVPYYLVTNQILTEGPLLFAIFGFAIVQLLVQVVFFLHLGTSKDQLWNTLAFVFTLITVAILVAGSIWIMYNLQHNMMPTMSM